jgi:hypothetical protein
MNETEPGPTPPPASVRDCGCEPDCCSERTGDEDCCDTDCSVPVSGRIVACC